MANITHYHGVKVPTSSHPSIRKLKRQHSGRLAHGNKIWDAAKVMIDYLSEHPLAPGLHILELGGGWGVVSAYLAKYSGAKMVSLDIDSDVTPFFEFIAELNQVEMDSITMAFSDLTVDDLQQFDLIIASDVCFWDSLASDLADVINTAAMANVPRIMIADPGRPPFYELAEWAQEEYDAQLIEWHSLSRDVRGYIVDIC